MNWELISCVGAGEIVAVIQRTTVEIVASLSEADERALQSRGASNRQVLSVLT